ncbi:CRISPR-associated endonuclease Cas2 [Opitutaceae bacterium TAV4]|uniref:CRISPR-associated endonuclease Cas2 n=1 Tax=Geminisphaera colitermitum TaxID=1148786 RepID=UPI0001965261|nr:CRISPR-associated endonuclease Cas2 [Geminisphaera colitermitum]RRJ94716.1 CRISPR-associated endonuclease Cas2 [Opitutaceae bacterium TAV4]RRJ98783.1 CRISPR-associated endonuclease Cas2 [Opitutaceae bacterium TAV3]
MRHTYIVSYDISDAKRLRHVFRICQDYGNHLQYSVFECDLSPTEKVELESKLKDTIHHKEDQVLFIGLGPTESRGDREISALGQAYHHFDAPCFVV